MSDLTPGIPDTLNHWLDELITDAGFASLDTWLAADTANARTLLELTIVHSGIASALASGHEVRGQRSEPRVLKSKIENRRSKIFLPLAAALLLSAAAVAIYLFVFAAPQPDTDDSNSDTPIATLIDNSSDGIVVYQQDVANPGEAYATGRYSIDSGSAELLLTSSVSVKLTGDTELWMHDDMSATLTRGAASFNCPPSAKGYTVHLPDGARVVDLGTAFSVTIDKTGRVDVRVTQGRVEWYPARADAEPLLVRAGEFVRVVDGRPVVAELPLVRVNFGPAGMPTEPGFTDWIAADPSTPSPTRIGGVGLSLHASQNDSPAPNNEVRSISRDNEGYTGDLSDLTRTWWGARRTGGSTVGGFVAIAISGADLGPGRFRFTSWHHDHDNQGGVIDIEVSIDGGSTFTVVVDDLEIVNGDDDAHAGAPNPASFEFTSNGVDDVVVRFTNVNASGGNFAVVNGFEIQPSTESATAD